MKTKEELDALKEEVKSLNEKLAELSEEELGEVTGGVDSRFRGSFRAVLPFIVGTTGGVDELAQINRHNIRSPLTDGAD